MRSKIVIDRHMTEPTDRSMPPEMSITVIPMTAMPSSENEPITTLRFARVAKYSLVKLRRS